MLGGTITGVTSTVTLKVQGKDGEVTVAVSAPATATTDPQTFEFAPLPKGTKYDVTAVTSSGLYCDIVHGNGQLYRDTTDIKVMCTPNIGSNTLDTIVLCRHGRKIGTYDGKAAFIHQVFSSQPYYDYELKDGNPLNK